MLEFDYGGVFGVDRLVRAERACQVW